jgi:hypothetical protein
MTTDGGEDRLARAGAATAWRSKAPMRRPDLERRIRCRLVRQATSTETPDGLEIALDKDSYKIGDTAKLKISPRYAGEVDDHDRHGNVGRRAER